MPVPQEVLRLVDQFHANRDAYRSGTYNETQLRREFLDPFFEALGWDVNNRQGYSERYKDVIHEDAIRVGGAPGAPDYCFRIGGQRKFFLEAKKPAVNLHDDISPAFQLRRYAWSAKLPLSVLSDFEELAVYDCRRRPDKSDKASTGRLTYLTYAEYPARWDEIAGIFSREAILRGAFDKYAETREGKRGTAEVDDAFLAEIEGWRELLARNLAVRNPGLTQRSLNEAVQVIIDRIVFLRICEDRGIEPYGRLQSLLNGTRAYPRLCDEFRRADQFYNSGLFHFAAEPGRPDPDDITLGLTVDDKTVKEILKGLYYPDSPYAFDMIRADILGQVYERFLGKVIRLTAGHQAKVEDKPEVRKAGGVYYTPTYIVEYIVRHTVGALLEGKRPEEVAGALLGAPASRRQGRSRRGADAPAATPPLRILDPACGSGSFLIGAYQFLLDWYRDRYVEDNPEKWAHGGAPCLYQAAGGDWRLTTSERKRILLAHIYGVDIDTQAVEVTRLSLLLKLLEGESQETLTSQLRLLQERALPDLSANIKCGNSLIGTDFYAAQLLTLPDDERYRVNAFDWPDEFPAVFAGANPGFDAVIGNPPYIRIQAMKEWAPVEVEFYKKRYRSAGKGNYDIYVVFVEKGLSLLTAAGRLGYILPHKFFNAQYGEPLRRIVSEGKHLSAVVHFGHEQVFPGATTYTCLLFLDKAGATSLKVAKVGDLVAWREGVPGIEGEMPADALGSSEWNLTVGVGTALFEKLSAMPHKLGDVADIFVGLQTSADDVFIMDLVAQRPDSMVLRSKALGDVWEFEPDLLHPLVSGTDVKRYSVLAERQWILFPYEGSLPNFSLVDFHAISARYPKTGTYLTKNRSRLEAREKGRFRDRQWHRFGRNQNIGIQEQTKLCVPRLVDRLYAAYDEDGYHYLDNVDVGGVVLKSGREALGLPYILGLLNARLLRWYFPFVSAPFRGGWLSANRQFLSQLPIRTINFDDPADRQRHDRMVALVERMLELHKQLAGAAGAHEKTLVEREIAGTDRQIDRLVYDLYGLSEEEIRIVEEATAR